MMPLIFLGRRCGRNLSQETVPYMLSAGFSQSAAAGRNALDTFMKDNLYKYDVIVMKDTDTGAQTYIVADTGPVHPARNGSRDGQK